jgi:hypothetical protein
MNFVEETDLRFALMPSTIENAGMGCFAAVDLKKGDYIEVIGVYVKKGGIADKCTAYATRYKFNGHDNQEANIVPMGYGGMINHTPDTAKQNVKLEFARGLARRSNDAGQVIYRFTRDIPAGEELLGYYGDHKEAELQWMNKGASYHDREGGAWKEFIELDYYNLGLLAKI